MTQDISIDFCNTGYDWCNDVRLVRCVGKRAIKVILRPSHNYSGYADEDSVVMKAARYAAIKGWRKIVVAPDDYEGTTVRGFNLTQYHHEQWQMGFIGKFLGFVE